MDKIKVSKLSELILQTLQDNQEEFLANTEEIGVALMAVLGGLIVDTAKQYARNPEELQKVIAMANAHNFAYLTDITNKMLVQQTEKENG